jgi:predicted ATPase
VRHAAGDEAGSDLWHFIPAIRDMDEILLRSLVTFFIGENGTGKSTLLEAIVVAAGFNSPLIRTGTVSR